MVMLVQPSVLFTATQNAQKRAAAEALLRGEKVEVPPPSSTDLGQLAKFLETSPGKNTLDSLCTTHRYTQIAVLDVTTVQQLQQSTEFKSVAARPLSDEDRKALTIIAGGGVTGLGVGLLL